MDLMDYNNNEVLWMLIRLRNSMVIGLIVFTFFSIKFNPHARYSMFRWLNDEDLQPWMMVTGSTNLRSP